LLANSTLVLSVNAIEADSNLTLPQASSPIKDGKATPTQTASPIKESNEATPPPKEGNATLIEAALPYIKAIMTPEDKGFPRLECPVPTHGRYDYLRNQSIYHNYADSGGRRKYFFALDLHQSVTILPRLLGSIIEAIRFLGPAQCALSIVEGRSDDGTFEVLQTLSEALQKESIPYFFKSSDKNPLGTPGARIEMLSDLRNEALEPMISNPDHYSMNDTTVVFLNDISLCMEDILELIHQRVHQKADMTCGMDWKNLWRDPTFYDVWIARGMNGDSFFEIPADGSWDSAWNLFWNNQKAKGNVVRRKPFLL